MVLTQVLCVAFVAAAPVQSQTQAVPRAPESSVMEEPHSPAPIVPYVEALGGLLGGFVGSLAATMPGLFLPAGAARDTYSIVAWSVAVPLTSAAGVYWLGGLNKNRTRSYGWALTGALAGEAVAAGVFFGLGGVSQVRGDGRVGPSFWPLILAPIASAIGATVVMELTSKAKPVAEITFAPLFLPQGSQREGYAKGVQLAARF